MGVKTDRATALFTGGFACSQAILAAFCAQYGMEEKTALRIACGLGGGVKCAEVCGAVTGAVLVVGLKYGQSDAADRDSRRLCSLKTEEFLRAFGERTGMPLVCRDILGCDIATPAGREQALREKLFTTRCVDAVRGAAAVLEEAGY